MKVISLFAGIGGFDLGFRRAGFEIAAHVEKDPACLKILQTEWPNALHFGDILGVEASDLPDAAVVTFGSPCQDLSLAGRREGLKGARSTLFYEATRIIRDLAPRGLEFAVWENVPGVFSSNGGQDFACILAELAKCGALDIGWRVLDCQFFGLAQRRKRVFLVADFRGQRVAEVLALAQGLRGDPPPSRQTGQAIAPTLTGRARKSGGQYPGGSDFESDGGLVVMAHGQANAEIAHVSPALTCNHEVPILARCLSAERDGYNEGTDQTYIPTPTGLRRFTPVECERLMGFPDNWTGGFSNSVRYRMLGNAVAVPVAHSIASNIELTLLTPT